MHIPATQAHDDPLDAVSVILSRAAPKLNDRSALPFFSALPPHRVCRSGSFQTPGQAASVNVAFFAPASGRYRTGKSSQNQEGGNDEKAVFGGNCFDVRDRGERRDGRAGRRCADAMGLWLRDAAAEPD